MQLESLTSGQAKSAIAVLQRKKNIKHKTYNYIIICINYIEKKRNNNDGLEIDYSCERQ